MSMFLKGRYVPPADQVIVSRLRETWVKVPVDVSAVDDPESDRFPRTQQSFKDDCDINLIMKRFERTGMLDHLNQFEGSYGDFTDVPTSYHDAVNQVLAAQDMFMTVPARVRAMFDNDPGKFLAFVDDPANAEKMVELGLARQAPAPSSSVDEGQGGPEVPAGGGA